MSLPISRLAQNPHFVLRGDSDCPVHARQWYELPGRDDGVPETWCYSDQLSYAKGSQVTLFAISTVSRVDISVSSETQRPLEVVSLPAVAVQWADTKNLASSIGCDWPAIANFSIGKDWPSGVYRIVLRPCERDDDVGLAEHIIVVRPDPGDQGARLLLITADATWIAYNDWGGSNHYEGIVEPQGKRFSPHLSIQRPFARGMIRLPSGAPRTLPDQPLAAFSDVDYPHMQWAWREGFSKKYASAGWATYERHFALWAESQGLKFDIATQRDLHFRPEIIENAACVVMVGHDEYWSWEMRDAIDFYIEQGGHVARFGGNFLWQIRLENNGLRQTCHKYLAEEEDPFRQGEKAHLTTTCWEADIVGRPGRSTFGLDASRGIYAGWGGLAPRGPGGFTVYRPEHWAFAGCGLGYGDLLGTQARIFGYEVDGLDYRIVEGLPYPEPNPGLPEGLEILGLGLARMRELARSKDTNDLFVGDEDVRFMAMLRYGDCSEKALQSVNRGSGMIVHFAKGKGEVFHAGTTEWVAGLLRRDPAVELVTANVLNKFLGAAI